MTPPRMASFCLELLYPAPLGEAVAGDLLEEFRQRTESVGLRAARAWYCRQVWLSAAPALAQRWRRGDGGVFVGSTALGAGALWMVTGVGHYVLSQIPRKAGPDLPWPYEVVRWTLAGALPWLGYRAWRTLRGEKRS